MRNRGSLSAMTVCLVPSMFMLAALTVDGGRLVVEYQRASDVAASAAREGAQQIVGIMDGEPHIDVARATASAEARIRRRGFEGVAVASRTTITVTIVRRVRLPLLALIGIGDRRVKVERVADAVLG